MSIVHTGLMTGFALATVLIGDSPRGSSSDPGHGGGSGLCRITLSGAQTASLGCSAATIGWSAADNATGGAILATGSPQVIISFRLPGQLATRSYHNADAGVVLLLAVREGSEEWVAGAGGGAATTGSATVTMTSLTTTTATADARIYAAHGTLTATLQPDPSTHATGTVSLHATF